MKGAVMKAEDFTGENVNESFHVQCSCEIQASYWTSHRSSVLQLCNTQYT